LHQLANCGKFLLVKFDDLLEIVAEEPVFATGFLLAGDVDPADVQRQLSRWVKAGRLFQLRRGLYALAPPYQKVRPHPFVIANRLVQGSYVSLQSALAHYGLIPEYVPVTTSVTVGRPGRWQTPLGSFEFRHVQPDLLRGCHRLELGSAQEAFVATPEKALLDLVYLEPAGDSPEYLSELRLQHLDSLNSGELRRQAEASGKPKLARAAELIAQLAKAEALEYTPL
jgi:predicted transcriptional regulator of viral defense system